MRRALIVGIDDYQARPLSGCVNDAIRIGDTLSRNEDGSANFACRLLTAPSANVTRSILKNNIEELFAHDADVALFYFSGHGVLTKLGGYLVTQDATKYDEGVAMSDVIILANQALIREVLIILDCCHSGAFGDIPIFDNDRAILREGISILASSRSSQSSLEVGGSGVFTSLVCDALNGGASDVCGNVTAASVYAYVDLALGAWDQRPLLKSHVSKLISLRQCRPEIEMGILRLLPKYFPDPYYEFPLDPSYEPDVEPRDKAHEEILRHLQIYRVARLLVPIGEEHMYYAAMRSKSCKLTPLGRYYLKVVTSGRL